MCSQRDSEFSVINTASVREMDLYCFWSSSSHVELNQGQGAGLESLGKGCQTHGTQGGSWASEILGTAAALCVHSHESLALLRSLVQEWGKPNVCKHCSKAGVLIWITGGALETIYAWASLWRYWFHQSGVQSGYLHCFLLSLAFEKFYLKIYVSFNSE